MHNVKSPTKKLLLMLIAGVLVVLLAAPSAMANNPVSLSLNGQVVLDNVIVENGVSRVSAEALNNVPGVTVEQEGYVFIRAFFEARGYEVEWDSQRNMIVVFLEEAYENGYAAAENGYEAYENGYEAYENGYEAYEAVVEEYEAAVERDADELVYRTVELLIGANTYRMAGTFLMDMAVSDAGGVSEEVVMELSMSGVFRYNPAAMHVIQTMDLSDMFAGLSPEELAMFGIETEMVTEMVWLNDVIYTTVPGFDYWIAQDLTGLDFMEEINNLLQMSPHQTMELMSQFGIENVLGASAVIDGREFYTVENYIDTVAFTALLEGFLGDDAGFGELLSGLGVTEEELAEIQLVIDALLGNIEISLLGVNYINKETLFTERVSIEMELNMSLPADFIPGEPAVEMAMSMSGYFNLYDFGAAIQLPDVSNAISMEAWLEMLEQMMLEQMMY